MSSDIPTQVRIRTDPDEDLAHRYEAIERAKDSLDVGNKTEAVLLACEHISEDHQAKQKALDYLIEELPAHKVETVADLLSTRHMTIHVEEPQIEIE